MICSRSPKKSYLDVMNLNHKKRDYQIGWRMDHDTHKTLGTIRSALSRPMIHKSTPLSGNVAQVRRNTAPLASEPERPKQTQQENNKERQMALPFFAPRYPRRQNGPRSLFREAPRRYYMFYVQIKRSAKFVLRQSSTTACDDAGVTAA